MSRNKRKQQKELWKLIEGLLMMAIIGSFFWVFDRTKSIAAGGVAAGCVLGLFVGMMIYKRILNAEKLKKSGIAEIDEMDGRQFEHYLGHLLKAHDFSVQVTRATGDYGADLVIVKNGKKIVVQAKRHSKNVGLKAVQEVQASISHYGASEGWVIANREYTDEAYSLAKSNNIRLIDREQLMNMILKLNPGAAASSKAVKEQLQTEEQVCSRCGNKMVLRKGPKGEFYGCSTFPKCRNVTAI
jgi:restriction system protein